MIDVGVSGKENDLYRGISLLDLGEPEQPLVAAVYTGAEIHVEQYDIHVLVVQRVFYLVRGRDGDNLLEASS